MSYIGSTPTTQSFIAGTDAFNGTGSATNFTLSRFVNSVNDVQVVVNNVVQYPPNYSVSGTTLTISPAPSAGTNNVYVRYLSTTLQSITVPGGSSVNGTFQVAQDTYLATSSGNVGVGTTSPDSLSNFKFVDVGSSGTNQGVVQANNGTVKVAIYANSNTGALATRTNHNLLLQTNATTALTIDTSQNVGIGTSSPVAGARLAVVGGGIQLSGGTSAQEGVRIQRASGVASFTGINNDNNAYNALSFFTSGSEAARIDTSGNLLVGTTSTTFSEKFSVAAGGVGINTAVFRFTTTDDRDVVIIRHARASGGTNAGMINFLNASGSTVGLIYSNGSNTVYATSSDYRLKENIQPMTGALARVAALQPCTYVWKEGGEIGEGFIAHELQAVCPSAVAGEKDAVNEDGSIKPQGIDTSFLVATIVAAMQEQQAMIDTMKQEIAELKEKVGE